jgi:transposase
MPSQYPQQFRGRPLRMVEESLPEHETESAAMKKVACNWGSPLRLFAGGSAKKNLIPVNDKVFPWEAGEEITRLKRENSEFRRANEILKSALAFFAAELDRPSDENDQLH